MKSILKNDNGFTGMLIVLPIIFIIALSILGTFVGYNHSETISHISKITSLPSNYEGMSVDQRIDYFNNLHGGNPYVFWSWDIFGIGAGLCYQFPDGYQIHTDQYWLWVNGYADDINTFDIVTLIPKLVTLDIPILNSLGNFGIFIKIILAFCIMIGIIDLIWLG